MAGGRPQSLSAEGLDLSMITLSAPSLPLWLARADELSRLQKAGYSLEDIAKRLGVSLTTLSRWKKAASWPKSVRATMLLAQKRFPQSVLYRISSIRFKDGTRKKTGKGKRSHLSLSSAVSLIAEGKNLPEPGSLLKKKAERLEQALNDERRRRHLAEEKIEKSKSDIRALEDQLSRDALSAALRETAKLKAELLRIKAAGASGSTAAIDARSEDLKRLDDQLSGKLHCKVQTLDWAKGLLLINAMNGDLLEGIREGLLFSRRI